jgi:hypothetical protein
MPLLLTASRMATSTAALGLLAFGDLIGATFPDAHEPPPTGWTGPVFSLSQDYPQQMPTAEPRPWKQIDFRAQPEQYARSLLTYVYEGNISAEWQIQKNAVRVWSHAPWMHTGASGREFIRGLTRERNSRPKELAITQACYAQNWAVGMYNPSGGYTVGKVWADPDHPDPKQAIFPDGTVSAKLLFTDAPTDAVPYLKDSVEWQANIDPQGPCDTAAPAGTRTPRPMRLLQIDIAVRDDRADPTTGWVFGTFTYNAAAPGQTPWDRMVPIGLMWGNDPTLTPTTAAGGQKPQETWINPNLGIPQHLGWVGRLNGPVDNPLSSCLSCHSTAQIPMISPMTPPSSATETQRLRWFRDVKAGVAFDAGAPEQPASLDYSLQLAFGIQNHAEALQVVALNQPAGMILSTIRGRRIYRVTREGTEDQPDFSLPGTVLAITEPERPARPSRATAALIGYGNGGSALWLIAAGIGGLLVGVAVTLLSLRSRRLRGEREER